MTQETNIREWHEKEHCTLEHSHISWKSTISFESGQENCLNRSQFGRWHILFGNRDKAYFLFQPEVHRQRARKLFLIFLLLSFKSIIGIPNNQMVTLDEHKYWNMHWRNILTLKCKYINIHSLGKYKDKSSVSFCHVQAWDMWDDDKKLGKKQITFEFWIKYTLVVVQISK